MRTNSSESDSQFFPNVELSADEKLEQADVFGFFDGLTDDAVNFINERFGGFNCEPLNLFESCFDVDMMVACCLSASDVKNFGKKAFDSLCQHFAELFTVEEVEAMNKSTRN